MYLTFFALALRAALSRGNRDAEGL
jgi:hypothetical protein